MTAGAAALALGSVAGAAITTGTAAHAATPVTLPFTNVDNPDAVAVDRTGNVYVASNPGESGTVLELPYKSSKPVSAGFTGLSQPRGLAAQANGDVYVADPGNLDVVKLVHKRDGSVRQVTLPLPGLGLFNEPDAVAVDDTGNLFVVENPDPEVTGGQPEVVEFKPTGAGYSSVTLPFTGLGDPTGVAVDTFGDVFVTDNFDRVLELPHGKKSQVTLLSGLAAVGVDAVAADGSGDVILTGANVDDVVELLRVSGYASQVTLATGQGRPYAVAVDTSFDVFFSSLLNDQVVELPGAALPPHIPGQPKITSATAGDGMATVSFTASKSDLNSGNPITAYTVTVRRGVNVTSGPAVETVSGATSPINVTGLTNGQNYTVTVYATNAAGNGPESAPAVVFPQSVPGAPTSVTAVNATPVGATSGTVNLTFNAPADNGGRPVLSYTAVSSPGGITVTAGAVTGSSTGSIQVTGLTLGTTYTFTVYATNGAGNGPPSAPSNPVTPAGVGIPSPPLVPGASTLDHASYVSCLPPADDGGSAIASYTVTSSPGGITASGSSCPILVEGLTDGTAYTFTVTATNADGGTSQPSQATAPVTPHVPSGTPPANDNYANAQPLTGASGSVTASNIGATLEPGEPNIQDTAGGASVWYTWTVPVTGTYQFDTCSANPDFPSNIGLFVGSTVSSASEFGPGPSQGICPAGEAGATLAFGPYSAGLVLHIKVDGFNEDGSNANPAYEGVFTLEWKQLS